MKYDILWIVSLKSFIHLSIHSILLESPLNMSMTVIVFVHNGEREVGVYEEWT